MHYTNTVHLQCYPIGNRLQAWKRSWKSMVCKLCSLWWSVLPAPMFSFKTSSLHGISRSSSTREYFRLDLLVTEWFFSMNPRFLFVPGLGLGKGKIGWTSLLPIGRMWLGRTAPLTKCFEFMTFGKGLNEFCIWGSLSWDTSRAVLWGRKSSWWLFEVDTRFLLSV